MRSKSVIVCKVRKKGNIYLSQFPEYPDCPEFVDDDLNSLLNVAPVYISIYVILNNDGRFIPHKQSVKEQVREISKDPDYFPVMVSCDVELILEILEELNVTPEAFYNWVITSSEEILQEAASQPVKSSQEKVINNKEKENQPENLAEPGTDIKTSVAQMEQKRQDDYFSIEPDDDDEVEDFQIESSANKSRNNEKERDNKPANSRNKPKKNNNQKNNKKTPKNN